MAPSNGRGPRRTRGATPVISARAIRGGLMAVRRKSPGRPIPFRARNEQPWSLWAARTSLPLGRSYGATANASSLLTPRLERVVLGTKMDALFATSMLRKYRTAASAECTFYNFHACESQRDRPYGWRWKSRTKAAGG